MVIRIFAFDLFGTLVNLESISKVFPELNIKVDDTKLFTEIWQSKQLQYAWLLNSMNNNNNNMFEPFSQLSVRALKFTAKVYGLKLSDDQISRLNEAKLNLDPFPDSKKGLDKLNESKRSTEREGQGVDKRLIILSNGERDKSDKLLSNCGLRGYFEDIISAEEVRKYKPSQEPYLLTSKRLNLSLPQIALVSSNLWDIAGAQSVGMQTYWINRGEDKKANEEIDIKTDHIFSSIEDLVDNIK
jgi:2-haloacid dehalogenase